MATIEELSAKFLLAPDANGFPRQFDGSLITPLVDCDEYNKSINGALQTVGVGTKEQNQGDKQFILVHNWWLGLEEVTYLTGDGMAGLNIRDDAEYTLDGPLRFTNPVPSGPTTGGSSSLLAALKDKASKGVDVRVMGWITSGVTEGSKNALASRSLASVNGATLRSIELLRAALGMKAITNEIAHTAGACHIKMLIVGNQSSATGYTGGLDFQIGRWGQHSHNDYFVPGDPNPRIQGWHDVMAKVDGPAVAALYEWYSTIWHEVIGRKPVTYKLVNQTKKPFVASDVVSHSMDRSAAGTPEMPPFPPGTVLNVGTHRVQSLRTSPVTNFASSNAVIPGLATSTAPAFAPQGLQEFQRGIQKAISGASKYIYLEDQALYSRDIMGYIHDRVVASSDLKVILVTGGADPHDAREPVGYLGLAMTALLQGISGTAPLSAAQRDRVRLYLRLTELDLGTGEIETVTAVPASPGVYRLAIKVGSEPPRLANDIPTDVLGDSDHAQVRIGTNVFPVVANPEIKPGTQITFDVRPGAFDVGAGGVPVPGPFQFFLMPGITMHAKTTLIDDQCAIIGSANAMRRSLFTDMEHSIVFLDTGDGVRDYRTTLWCDHFRHLTPADFNDIDAALHAWNSPWGTAGAAPPRPPHIIQLPLDKIPNTVTPDQQLLYDAIKDVDSRQTWGGIMQLRRLQAIGKTGS